MPISCCATDHEILLAILEQQEAIFDRLSQVNQSIADGGADGGGAVGSFQSLPDMTVAVAGTAVQGTAFATVRGILLVARPTNIGNIYVGDAGITNNSGSEKGLILSQAGMPSTILPVDNLNKVWINADNAGDLVGVVVFT